MTIKLGQKQSLHSPETLGENKRNPLQPSDIALEEATTLTWLTARPGQFSQSRYTLFGTRPLTDSYETFDAAKRAETGNVDNAAELPSDTSSNNNCTK